MSKALFEDLVRTDLEQIRTSARPLVVSDRQAQDAVAFVGDMNGRRCHLDEQKQSVEQQLKEAIPVMGTPSWDKASSLAIAHLKAAGFPGVRHTLDTVHGTVGLRHTPTIDHVAAFAALGPGIGEWRLREAATTLRGLHKAGMLEGLPPDVLAVDRSNPISGYTLMPPRRSPAPGLDTGAPVQAASPLVTAADLTEAYGRRSDLDKQIAAIETQIGPAKETIKEYLLMTGDVSDTVVRNTLVTGDWFLVARPSITVDPVRLVPIRNQQLAEAVNGDDDDPIRKAWDNLQFVVNEKGLKERSDWTHFARPYSEAQSAFLPVRRR